LIFILLYIYIYFFFKSTATKCVVETLSGQDIADGFQLLIGLAEIHVPRMWVEDDEDENQTFRMCPKIDL
jgi:hypothetical protein